MTMSSQTITEKTQAQAQFYYLSLTDTIMYLWSAQKPDSSVNTMPWLPFYKNIVNCNSEVKWRAGTEALKHKWSLCPPSAKVDNGIPHQ